MSQTARPDGGSVKPFPVPKSPGAERLLALDRVLGDEVRLISIGTDGPIPTTPV